MRSKPQLVAAEVLMQYDETEKPLLAFDHSPDNAQHSSSKVRKFHKYQWERVSSC